MSDPEIKNRRVLLVDDNPAIHDDFHRVLAPGDTGASPIDVEAALLFQQELPTTMSERIELDSAFQGQEALAKVEAALAKGLPYAMAFVDMRMPPGWDGLETIQRLWKVAPDLEIVVCTAYSDHSWQEIQKVLGHSERLLILKKPFDKVEVQQLTMALTEKWNLRRMAELQTQGLENLVRARTREVVQAYESKRDFLSNVSHEFLTPINGILGLAEVLRASSLAQDQRDSVNDIQISGTRLLKLVQQVLLYNTLDAGKLDVNAKTVDGQQICRSVAETYLAPATRKGLTLIQTPQEKPLMFHGDGDHVRTVLSLLIDNAVKFTTTGSVRIQAEPASDTPGHIHFKVIDTGQGIAPNQLELLNRPFTQLDSTLTRNQEGIGLGLTLARQLLHLMGSKLEIVTKLGEGSTFGFTLPLSASTQGKSQSLPPVARAA